MSEKPEALRLADLLKTHFWEGKCGRDEWDAAAKELRRQHADNERLRQKLRSIAEIDFRNVDSIWARLLLREVVDKAKAALRRDASTAPAAAAVDALKEPATEPAIRDRGEVPR